MFKFGKKKEDSKKPQVDAPPAKPDNGDKIKSFIDRIDEKEGLPVMETEPTPMDSYTPRNKSPKAKGSAWETFKNFAIVFSFLINMITVMIVLGLVVGGFEIKRARAGPLIGGLYNNFVKMDQATIKTTVSVNGNIPVNDSVTAKFDLPLKQETNVVLSKDTVIRGASVNINGGILQLNNAPTVIFLPKGTVLPVLLDLTVPVDQKIPVNITVPIKNLQVPVAIPLSGTELHTPFASLRDLFAPYNDVVNQIPDSWSQLVSGKK
jgi:hypothetical protein